MTDANKAECRMQRQNQKQRQPPKQS